MAKIVINTDTSLTFDPESKLLSLRISEESDNVLDFNSDGQLSMKEMTKFAHVYYPMNGICGESKKALSQIQCDSSCTRLYIFDENGGDQQDGAIWDGMVGDPDHEGMNIINLCKAVMSQASGSTQTLDVNFWAKDKYQTRNVSSVSTEGDDWYVNT